MGYQPLQNTMLPTGSIRRVMEELVALEESVHPDLRVYMWRENTVQLPALWNVLGPSPFQMMDLSRGRDSLLIVASIGLPQSDIFWQSTLCDYADAFRNVIDQAFWQSRGIPGNRGPLNGTATKAIRQSMSGPTVDSFNGIDAHVIQFPLTLDLDRSISPTGR